MRSFEMSKINAPFQPVTEEPLTEEIASRKRPMPHTPLFATVRVHLYHTEGRCKALIFGHRADCLKRLGGKELAHCIMMV